ncbi:uncharacterized protein LOC114748654 isoform X1 [Neltuma alba]|uniref:uncharacterized protein LOC114748654 isoform X1 n=1 Tax=Neltuma alba TaxID=207710 RepID=UPI0010A2E902|nr:uncharacterized protein LOC114748654 isoform X1 [Prosopis alba]
MPPEDSTAVKVENQEEEEDKKSLGSKKAIKATIANAKPHTKTAKVKKEEPEADDSPIPVKAASSASRSKQPKVKKEEPEDSADDDDIPLAKRSSTVSLKKFYVLVHQRFVSPSQIKINGCDCLGQKEPKKKNKIKEEGKKKGEPASEQKKQRKVYDLPGQKRDPPEEKDPLRIFYETLYKQAPDSEMAQLWMMESGLLPEELAMKVYEKKQKKGLQSKLSSPLKAATSVKSRSQSVTVKKKTRSTPVPCVVNKKAASTQKQSKKRKVKDDSDTDSDSADELILPRAKKRKQA